MSRGFIPIMVARDNDKTSCPTCGMAVRVVRRTYGDKGADHYEALVAGEHVAQALVPHTPEKAAELRELRKGKKTVAIVGMAPTSCALAPFDDEDVEIWALNEMHAFSWCTRATRWFQIHATESWKRYIAKRDVRGHADWLRRNPLDIPIYMQFAHPEVPKSIDYPLHEVVENAFPLFRRGNDKVKYFTSTFAYMMGIATLPSEGFQRIEIYGFEMADDIEYVKQKACAEFWIGFALGRGIEIYTPENCQILWSALYGGNEQGQGWARDSESGF